MLVCVVITCLCIVDNLDPQLLHFLDLRSRRGIYRLIPVAVPSGSHVLDGNGSIININEPNVIIK